MSYDLVNLILHSIETISILSLIFAIFEIKRSNDQNFRNILANYLRLMRETLQKRFENKEDQNSYKTTLLMLDQCIFSVLNRNNRIKMSELTDELSRLSTSLYFDNLKEVKDKMQWFKTELFR